MNSRIFGLHGALAALALVAACKKDPTAVDVGTPNSLTFELDARTLAVADSFHSFVILRDRLGNPLETPVTVTSCNTGVASVIPTSDAPQVRTAFFVKGVTFSATPVCVTATAGGFTDTMMVTTVPFALVITTGPDTINSGVTGAYAFTYRDAKNLPLGGVTNPTFTTGDTTIAKAGATVGQVSGRAPGLTVVTATLKIVPASGDTVRIAGTKNITVVAAAFTGTTSGATTPGSFVVIRRDLAGPVFDANTAVSFGAVDSASRSADTIKVRVPDVDSAGPHDFTVTGVGGTDVAYVGTYTVAAPPAFAGTFLPNPIQSGITLKIARNVADAPFDSSKNIYLVALDSVKNLAAIPRPQPATGVPGTLSGFKPDTLSIAMSDLQAGGTYYFQTTRLGPNGVAWRGSVTLPVGVWGGTVTPSTGAITDRIVLRRGGGDPLFDADSRVFLNGKRAFVESFSTDTAVIGVPATLTTGPVGLRITRMDATQSTVAGAAAFTSTTPGKTDRFDHGNDQVDTPSSITSNGTQYMTLSGNCVPGDYEGVPTIGADDCDDFYKITNNTAVDATVTVTINWNPGTDVSAANTPDIDFLICDGAALGTVAGPQCGNFTTHADEINTDGESGARPETSTFTLPANSTYIIWVNMFNAHGAASTLYQFKISGLP